MICAEDEIGIGQSHSGIIILNKNAKNGEKANKYFDLYEGSFKQYSLNVAFVLGVARDIKAVLKSSINMPDVSHFKSKKKFSIKKNDC